MFGTSHGDIESSEVAEEAGTESASEGDDDDVFLRTLERVDGVDFKFSVSTTRHSLFEEIDLLGVEGNDSDAREDVGIDSFQKQDQFVDEVGFCMITEGTTASRSMLSPVHIKDLDRFEPGWR